MAQWNATALVVDDRDPDIEYSSGWQQVTTASGSGEFLLTRSGATSAGQTATFTFNGTGIEVYGSIGPVDSNGQPTTSYTVDGSFNAAYTAPKNQAGSFTAGNLYYRSPPLPDGLHELVITNLNGTSPNVYWLDYILYTPSTFAVPQSSTGQIVVSPSSISLIHAQANLSGSPATLFASQSSATATVNTSNISMSLPGDQTSIVIPPTSSIPPTFPTGNPEATSNSVRRGPFTVVIAGGIIAGVALIALVVVFLYLWRSLRTRKVQNAQDTEGLRSLPVSRDPFRRITRFSQYSDDFRCETPSVSEDSVSTVPSTSHVLHTPLPLAPASVYTSDSRLYERFSFVGDYTVPTGITVASARSKT